MVDADARGQRIDVMAFALEGEMQMGSGRQAARAHPADYLTQGHQFSIRQPPCDFRQMPVDAHHSLLVMQPYAEPQLSAPSGVSDPSVRDRLDRGPILGHQIDADVRPVFVENRMVTMEREARGDVVELDREAQDLLRLA